MVLKKLHWVESEERVKRKEERVKSKEKRHKTNENEK